MVNAKSPIGSDNHLTSAIRHLTSDCVVIATHNPGKLAEMRELLAPYGIAAISAGEVALAEPEETGMTFAENARIKAAAAATAARLPALADDSGLVVEALDGAPGIHSARWYGRRAAIAASVMIRCFCRTVSNEPSAKCRARRNTDCRHAAKACRIAPARS